MNAFEQILTSVGLSTVVIGAFVAFGREWILERLKQSIQHEYDQRLETHKAQLKAQSDVEIEKLKSQLHITAVERGIKLSKVFEKQAEAIAELYAKLDALVRAMAEYTNVMSFENTPPLEQRRKVMGEKFGALLDFYNPNKIYIPKDTQATVDAFIKEMNAKALRFMFEVEQDRRGPKERDTWMDTYDYVTKDCVKVMGKLDDDMKTILGLAENTALVKTSAP